MAIKTSSAKAKGRKLQQFTRDLITKVFGLGEGDAESRSMGAGGVDILLSPLARSVCPFSLEAKNTKTQPSLKEIKQAEYNKYPHTLAAVVWHPPGAEYKDSLIMFKLEDFLIFWKENTIGKN